MLTNVDRRKRSALGNLTNANANVLTNKVDGKSVKDATKGENEQKLTGARRSTKSLAVQQIETVLTTFPKPTGPKARPPVNSKKQTRATSKTTANHTDQEWSGLKPASLVPIETKKNADVTKTARRLSNDFEKSESSLYVSALEYSSTLEVISSQPEEDNDEKTSVDDSLLLAPNVPDDVHDFDKENWDDPYQVSVYAMQVFEYMKGRETAFQIQDYFPNQKNLTIWMRALLVDWMVEVQER